MESENNKKDVAPNQVECLPQQPAPQQPLTSPQIFAIQSANQESDNSSENEESPMESSDNHNLARVAAARRVSDDVVRFVRVGGDYFVVRRVKQNEPTQGAMIYEQSNSPDGISITVNLPQAGARPKRINCSIPVHGNVQVAPHMHLSEPNSSRNLVMDGNPIRELSQTCIEMENNQMMAMNSSTQGPVEIRPPVLDYSAPPPYELPKNLPKLPTYEQVQREKALEGEPCGPNLGMGGNMAPSPDSITFLATIDPEANDPGSKLLGTDFMFITAFFVAFIFNWVGFLLIMCFCQTVAARYGALSGFGLSLAKWTLIVKNSAEIPAHNFWIWWLITGIGILICMRSMLQYINIKKGWRMMSADAQERLLFFY